MKSRSLLAKVLVAKDAVANSALSDAAGVEGEASAAVPPAQSCTEGTELPVAKQKPAPPLQQRAFANTRVKRPEQTTVLAASVITRWVLAINLPNGRKNYKFPAFPC